MTYLEFTNLPEDEQKVILTDLLERANKLQREAVGHTMTDELDDILLAYIPCDLCGIAGCPHSGEIREDVKPVLQAYINKNYIHKDEVERECNRAIIAELEELEILPNVYPEMIDGMYTHVEAIYKSAIRGRIKELQSNTDGDKK